MRHTECNYCLGGTASRSGGFGTFEVKERAARVGRNPKTKEPVNIPASKHPTFKEALNKSPHPSWRHVELISPSLNPERY